ncbi:MAG: aminoacetone oxidase family FAD-binding enzyme, partial [Pirellulaceae bacterium]|nr:aminoacetone oxidase family FAD-binding enzyme [Pirellulaceae bacterium]
MPAQPIRVVVIGAGAAGMVAAAQAAKRGADVTLLEKNAKTGVKILMSGGTRCNLTHNTDARGITDAFGHAKRFLQPSVGGFPPSAVVEMFNTQGVPTKIESTGKIFPESDRAVHVRDALHRRVIESGATIQLKSGVDSITRAGDQWQVAVAGESIHADRLIVTAGGKSWPACGTTGDAYHWLERLGHTIVRPRPALVPLVGGSAWTHDQSGITLPDCVATVRQVGGKKKTKPLIIRRASWLFTHFGFSGPAAMDVSGVMTAAATIKDVRLTLDLVPELQPDDLRSELTNRAGHGGRRKIESVIGQWLPTRLVDALVHRAGGSVTIAQLPRRSFQQLVDDLKQLPLPVSGTRGFGKAEVTAGGVALSEVDPKTMASRKAEHLFIAGEVLDVDGWIGGYNFQAA